MCRNEIRPLIFWVFCTCDQMKGKTVEHISTNFAESGLQADSGEIGTNTFEQVF